MGDSDGAPELRLLDALFRLNKLVLADARTNITEVADLDLGDFLMLRSVEMGVDSPGGLARDLGFNPAVVSRALTKLAKAGLIERRIDVDDSRRSKLELTAEGGRITAAVSARVRPALAERLQRLSERQLESVLRGLAILSAEPD